MPKPISRTTGQSVAEQLGEVERALPVDVQAPLGHSRCSASAWPAVTRLRRGWKLRIRRSKCDPAGSARGPVGEARLALGAGARTDVAGAVLDRGRAWAVLGYSADQTQWRRFYGRPRGRRRRCGRAGGAERVQRGRRRSPSRRRPPCTGPVPPWPADVRQRPSASPAPPGPCRATSRPIGSEAVAAGEGAFSTWTARGRLA